MRDVLFVQGGGKDVHEEWDSRLVESLRRELGPLYNVRYPWMPKEADPQLWAWRPVLERELASLRSGGIVVGHSVGGAIVTNVLADSASLTNTLGAIVLIAAPFMGKGGWASEDGAPRSELAKRISAAVPVLLYHGEDDKTVPVAHVDLYGEAVAHARVRRLPGRDHQLNNNLSEIARDLREFELEARVNET